MPMRVSGMNSGIDTDAVVKELVQAYSTKQETYKKALTKQQWTMDAWKTVNTKVYDFYSKSLASMRYSKNYNLRTSSVSNSNVAKVTASSTAVNGTQRLSVQKLATSGYLTGAKITDDDGKTYGADAKLSDLGLTGGTLSLNGTEINIDGDTTLSGLASKLQEAGVNANYDANNGRFFISSKNSGKENEFTLIAKDGAGLDALKKLGIYAPTEDEATAYGDLKNMDVDAETNALYLKNYKADINSKLTQAKADAEAAQTSLDRLAKLTAEGYDYTADFKDDEDLTAEGAKTAKQKYDEELASYDKDALESTLATANADVEAYNEILAKTDEELLADKDSEIYAAAETTIADRVSFANSVSVTAGTKGATRIEGDDAIIYLNGAQFTSTSNTFSINGLTIEATATTNPEFDEDGELIGDENAVSITTSVDTQGIYDKIKEFLKSYNEMIKYIDTQYNADSAKGYEPLSDDEKEAMTDKQIEEWEEKIKTSLLRKDANLNSISSGLKTAMLGATYTDKDGNRYTIASFGIASAGYFTSDTSERGTFHIDGDADDSLTNGNTDKLMAAIAKDPESVVEFFQTMASNVYDYLSKKMSSSSVSSAFTIYNDKSMASQYSDYQDKVDEWDKKLEDYEEYYYSKFTAMEKAMAELNEKTSALSGLLGN